MLAIVKPAYSGFRKIQSYLKSFFFESKFHLRNKYKIQLVSMKTLLCLSPRYLLDDRSSWLEGVDPSRRYWIAVNGDKNHIVAIPGPVVSSRSELKQIIFQFRLLQPTEKMTLTRAASACTIHCIRENYYTLEVEDNIAPVLHLFDRETLDALLMTAHPDWRCSPADIDLGRKLLMRSFGEAEPVNR